MATTRFYLPSSGSAPCTPAYSASWYSAVGAWVERLPAVTTKSSTAYEEVSFDVNSASDVTILCKQHISAAQAAYNWTTSDTIKWQQVWRRSSSTTVYCYLIVRVVSSDGGTFRGTLYEGAGPTNAPSWPPTNRSIGASGAAVNVQNAVSMQTDDRIVIETGCKRLGDAWTGGITHYYDDESSDLPENETTGQDGIHTLNPWIEFTYGAGGGAGGGAADARFRFRPSQRV